MMCLLCFPLVPAPGSAELSTGMHDMSFQHQTHPGFVKYLLMSHFLLIYFCLERLKVCLKTPDTCGEQHKRARELSSQSTALGDPHTAKNDSPAYV